MNSEQPGASGRRGIAPGVDLDLLADYAAGALEASAEERASALVASDPRWADALHSLRAADALVRADLARLADTPQPLPADIATRLDLALRRAGTDRIERDHADLSDDLPGVPGDHPESAGTTERAGLVDLRAARLRRRFRIAAVASVAAGLLALAVPAGYLVLGQNGAADSEADMAATEGHPDAGAPEAVPSDTQGRDGPAALGDRTVPMVASGLDYRRDTISAVPGQRAETARTAPQNAPRELSRLLAIPALDDCLTAIRTSYPGTVTIVDYARFEGAPALLVAVTEGTGSTRVVVTGPDCGRSGIDERYSATT